MISDYRPPSVCGEEGEDYDVVVLYVKHDYLDLAGQMEVGQRNLLDKMRRVVFCCSSARRTLHFLTMENPSFVGRAAVEVVGSNQVVVDARDFLGVYPSS